MGQQGNRLMTEVAGVGDKTEGSKMWKQTQPGRSPFCALCVCVLLYDVVVNVSRCVRVALCLCECEGWWGWIWGDGVEQYRMFFFVLLLVASFCHCLGGGDGGGGGGSGELTYTHKKSISVFAILVCFAAVVDPAGRSTAGARGLEGYSHYCCCLGLTGHADGCVWYTSRACST